MSEEEFLTVNELAHQLKVPVSWVYIPVEELREQSRLYESIRPLTGMDVLQLTS